MELAMKKACRAQLTKLVKEANDLLLNSDNFNVREASLHIVKIKAAHESLQKATDEAKMYIKDDQIEDECLKILEYNEKAVVSMAKLEQRIAEENQSVDTLALGASASSLNISENNGSGNRRGSTRPVAESMVLNNTNMPVRLPKLDLIKFNGNYHEWPAFWEQFDSVINSNESLDESTKFCYLKSVLLGNAAITIQGLTSSRTSYKNAVQLLKEEYGNTDKITDSYIQKLLSLSSIKDRKDIVSLRKLYNTSSKITKSLQTLGIEPNSYGMMVKSIILKALPLSLRIEFNKKYAIHDMNNETDESSSRSQSGASSNDQAERVVSYENQILKLLSFIKLEVDSVEQAQLLSEEKSSIKSKENYKDKFSNRFKGNKDTFKNSDVCTAAGLFTSVREQCFFCKSNSHLTLNCNEQSVSLEQRKNMLKSSARCFRCTKPNHNSRHCKTNIQCVKCKGKHATIMCDPEYVKKRNSSAPAISNEQVQSAANLFANLTVGNVYLQTACAELELNNTIKPTFVRLVIDGGSQVTFIKECVSRQLNLPVIGTHKLSIMSFGAKEQGPSRICKRVLLKLKNIDGNSSLTIKAVEVPEICFDNLSPPSLESAAISKFSVNHKLADVSPENSDIFPGISLLIGADCYWQIVTGETKRLSDSQMAINTHLGWTIHGINSDCGFSLNVNVANVFHVQYETNEFNSVDIKQFWDLEAVGIKNVESTIKHCTSDFVQQNIVFNGYRYSVSLPWLNSNSNLDSNFNGAMTRVKALTNKLIRMGKLLEYDRVLREYFENDCAQRAPEITVENKIYFMPHRPVYREDKDTTKVRVVFDASARAPGMSSVNDLLSAGENLVPLLLKILINFRIGKVALTADIEKAFLQIEINENDRDAHSFLWYATPINDMNNLPEIVKFRMQRVTFGVTCSPFILAATLYKHLTEQPQSLKDVCDIMLESFYVDDLILSVNSIEEANRIFVKGKEILKRAGMNLRKWSTNKAELKEIINNHYEKESEMNEPKVKKILGLNWYTETDELNIDINPVLEINEKQTYHNIISKRKVLQTVAKVYDPLGLLSPFIIRAKILMQQIWIRKYDWDQNLPVDLIEIWSKWCSELQDLSAYYIPRCVMENSKYYVELHIFSDASPQAYGAVAYLRTIDNFNNISCNVLMAKNRVSPIDRKGNKELTLPKLELTGALCAARLQKFIIHNLNIKFDICILWTDSKIALHWIRGKASRWKPYVCHRVMEIQKISVGEWRHCKGVENPADLLTRGVKAKYLIESKLWQNGPSWILDDRTEWPEDDISIDAEIINAYLVQTENDLNQPQAIFSMEKYSSFEKLLRITAYVFRFIWNSKNSDNVNKSNIITATEMLKSQNYWIKVTQNQYFTNEVTLLKRNQPINVNSNILTLNPFLDENGILRLGGRMQNSLLSYEAKHPIILPKKAILTDQIILNSHILTCHGGVNITLCQIRKTFWIIQARQRVKTILKNCLKCKKLRSKPANEPFAPLPRNRLKEVSPFKITGVDFAGPIYVLSKNGTIKMYIMLLTCAVIRAVHLEVVPDLTNESCIRALRRFISRRGIPDTIYSDNAKTFKRTAMELKELEKILCGNEVQAMASQRRIEWKFIVERAAWWGGFWERLIKSVKDALKVTLGRRMINIDEFQTILVEIEATINSRPLTYLHDDSEELLILTPGHFLLGEHLCGFSINSNSSEISRNEICKIWKARNDALHKFWKRWSIDYLQQLRGANMKPFIKSNNLKAGDIVLLHDQNLPRLLWKMVRINKIFTGRDGKVRACEIITSNRTVLRRPIQLLYPLEITAAGEDVENSQTITQPVRQESGNSKFNRLISRLK